MSADADVAEEVARPLVRAKLSGHDSHGVIRIAQYVGQMDRGELIPANRPSIIHETLTTLLVDAKRGFGHFSTAFTIEQLSKKARLNGMASAAIRHATHVGRVGEFAERCSDLGLILLITVGMAGSGVGGVVIHGGSERFLGSNVWAIGIPGLTHPMVFDGSMGNIALGKVQLARAEGRSLPPGCIIDHNGTPSTDPEDYYAGGAVLPLGGALAGHKGYGLALASALLGGLAMIGDRNPTMAGGPVREGADAKGRMAGVFMVAIDPGAFGDSNEYRSLVEDCLSAAKRVTPAFGFEEVSIPGEGSRNTRERRLREGIALAATTCAELASVGQRFHVVMPDSIAAPTRST
jgi:LDH2 family malate/lactate/ureidoglycolate dehydrogenase